LNTSSASQPAGGEAGCFVEIKTKQGKSIDFGEWVQLSDGN